MSQTTTGIADKSVGDSFSSTEFNTLKNAVDNNAQDAESRLNNDRFVATNVTESIDVGTVDVIQQQTASITTSLTNVVTGSRIVFDNASGGNCTLNITLNGTVSPVLANEESVNIYFDGTEWRIK